MAQGTSRTVTTDTESTSLYVFNSGRFSQKLADPLRGAAQPFGNVLLAVAPIPQTGPRSALRHGGRLGLALSRQFLVTRRQPLQIFLPSRIARARSSCSQLVGVLAVR